MCQISIYSVCLYAELEQVADAEPVPVYSNESNELLAQHLGKLAPWINRLLAFASTLGVETYQQRMLIDRCEKRLKDCSKVERIKLIATYPDLLSKPPSARTAHEARAFEPSEDGLMAKRRAVDEEAPEQEESTVSQIVSHRNVTTPLQRHSFFPADVHRTMSSVPVATSIPFATTPRPMPPSSTGFFRAVQAPASFSLKPVTNQASGVFRAEARPDLSELVDIPADILALLREELPTGFSAEAEEENDDWLDDLIFKNAGNL